MPERFSQVDEAFRAALRVEPASRAAFVERHCADDHALKGEVLALLAEDEAFTGTAGPLDRPALGKSLHLDRLVQDQVSPAAPLPESVGRYRVISRLGVGGMGVVYEAEQDNPRRTVALKVINSGVASPEMLRRFGHEAQVLGRLQHPGIAQIFEAGTFDSGAGAQPFFAMELIRGDALTEYATKRALPARDRLELIAHTCDAVQHAHQRGVIHRDLKPGNILVVEQANGLRPGCPTPKILDFGVARATDADVQRATLQTTAGQLVGTLPYMSPEQAAGDPQDLDTRSDVYSLGVIAYELLAGQLPYAVRDKYMHEAVRVIREVDPTSLSSIDRALGGDIETVIVKALEKDKTRRYQSASEFGDDIRRCLRDEPILARPPTALYQFRKFAKRNRPLVAAAAAVMLVLIVGIIGVCAALARAVNAEDRAIRDRDRAIAINGFFTRDLLAQAAPDRNPVGADVSVRELLDRAAARIADGYNGSAEDEAAVQGVIGDTYFALGLYQQAEPHWRRAFEILHGLHGAQHEATLQALAGLAQALESQGKFSEVEPLYRTLLDAAPQVLGPEHPETLTFVNNYAELLGAQGKLGEAAALHEKNLAIRERVLGPDNDDTLESMNNLAAIDYQRDRLAEAEPLFRRTVDARTRLLGEEHPLTLVSLSNLGVTLRRQGKLAETEPIYRKVLEADRRVQGPEHPDTLTDMHNLASLLSAQGKFKEAEALFRQTIDLRRKVLGERHAVVAHSLVGLGEALCDDGQLEAGEVYLREALDIRGTALPPGHRLTNTAAAALASSLVRQGKHQQAEQVLIDALRQAEAAGSGPAATDALGKSFIALYTAWEQPEQADEWKARMSAGSPKGGEP